MPCGDSRTARFHAPRFSTPSDPSRASNRRSSIQRYIFDRKPDALVGQAGEPAIPEPVVSGLEVALAVQGVQLDPRERTSCCACYGSTTSVGWISRPRAR